jgi:hypothetical protein
MSEGWVDVHICFLGRCAGPSKSLTLLIESKSYWNRARLRNCYEGQVFRS